MYRAILGRCALRGAQPAIRLSLRYVFTSFRCLEAQPAGVPSRMFQSVHERSMTMIARFFCVAMFCALPLEGVTSAAAPTAEEALKLTPVQSEVDLDKPTAEKIAKCKLESFPDQGGWAVYNDEGQLLRRFLD